MVFLLLFVYHFPRFRHAERREFRIVFALSMALNAGVLGLNVYNHFILQWHFSDTRLWDTYWLVFYCSLATQFLGAAALLFRKAARLSGRSSRSFLDRIVRPHGRDAESARALGAIILLPTVAVVASLAMTYGLLPFSLATYLTWLGLLLFYLGFVVTYLNHSADPLTLQMKLLGVTLVLILSTMGLVALFVGETSAKDYPPPPLPGKPLDHPLHSQRLAQLRHPPHAGLLRSGSGAEGGYGIRTPRCCGAAFRFPVLLRPLPHDSRPQWPHDLPRRARTRERMGRVQPAACHRAARREPGPLEGQGVHIKSTPDSMTVTWFRLPELGAENVNTIQLVLRADGTIDMRFEDLSPFYGPSIEQQYNYAAASTTGETLPRAAGPPRFHPC